MGQLGRGTAHCFDGPFVRVVGDGRAAFIDGVAAGREVSGRATHSSAVLSVAVLALEFEPGCFKRLPAVSSGVLLASWWLLP